MTSSPLLSPTDTLLIFGDTGDGKTAQVGELAKHIHYTTGKKTRLYTADKGDAWGTIQHLINIGWIDLQRLTGDPWKWLSHAVQGQVLKDGQWVSSKEDIGLLVYEGLTSVAETLLIDVTDKVARGQHSGGEKRFTLGTEAGMVSSANQTDVWLIQLRMQKEVWASQNNGLPTIWTSALRRAQDDQNNPITGPEILGKAMTTAAPRWFKYSFRIEGIAEMNGEKRHVLHLGSYKDMMSGMVKVLGNARVPLDGGDVEIPNLIEPASVIEALKLLKAREKAAEAAVQQQK